MVLTGIIYIIHTYNRHNNTNIYIRVIYIHNIYTPLAFVAGLKGPGYGTLL